MELFFSKRTAYLAMILLMCIWGFDYVTVKLAREELPSMSFLLCKYLIGLTVAAVFMALNKKKMPLKKKHIPRLVLCTLVGELFYYYCEYTAMDYMPVGLVTVVLTLCPIVSVIAERILFGKAIKPMAVVSMVICIMGVSLIIGVDMDAVLSGRFIGYLLCTGAVIFWVSYNFLVESLEDEYDPISLTFYQIICIILIVLPMGIHQFPGMYVFHDTGIVLSTLYSGFIGEGLGFFIYVASLRALGSTSMVTLNNLLPVTTALAGWLFLNETLSPLQILGIAIVIAGATAVIRINDDKPLKDMG